MSKRKAADNFEGSSSSSQQKKARAERATDRQVGRLEKEVTTAKLDAARAQGAAQQAGADASLVVERVENRVQELGGQLADIKDMLGVVMRQFSPQVPALEGPDEDEENDSNEEEEKKRPRRIQIKQEESPRSMSPFDAAADNDARMAIDSQDRAASAAAAGAPVLPPAGIPRQSFLIRIDPPGMLLQLLRYVDRLYFGGRG